MQVRLIYLARCVPYIYTYFFPRIYTSYKLIYLARCIRIFTRIFFSLSPVKFTFMRLSLPLTTTPGYQTSPCLTNVLFLRSIWIPRCSRIRDTPTHVREFFNNICFNVFSSALICICITKRKRLILWIHRVSISIYTYAPRWFTPQIWKPDNLVIF